MSDDLVIIGQREILGKDCKIYGDIDNPLFLAKEVATWIDYDESSVHKLVAMVTHRIAPLFANRLIK